jgi:nitrite reductase/ring-hydroxylating ferredoxin subunit
MRHELFSVGELAPGELREVSVEGVSVVVIRKPDGSFRALRNRCWHQGGALSDGRLEPMLDGAEVGEYFYSADRYVIRCPLHQYEFDVDTGLSPADPDRVRVRSYPVSVVAGRVLIDRRPPSNQ